MNDDSCTVFDVQIKLLKGENLPVGDFFSSDPYVEISVIGKEGEYENLRMYRSFVKYKTLNPEWDEQVTYKHMKDFVKFRFEVKDKDFGISRDDTLGTFVITIKKEDYGINTPKTIAGDVGKKGKVTLEITLKDCDIETEPKPALFGPVRCRIHYSPMSGVMTQNFTKSKGFATYKLFLHSVPEVMGHKQHWNEKYPAAQKIFTNPVVMGSIKAQHASLYKSQPSNTTEVLKTAEEFFELLDFGQRAQQIRYYTYVLMEESMRFSETGTAFFNDMLSKHALHATAAPEVYYAGEFCIVEDDNGSGGKGHTLVIDNNSGTYAPDGAQLPQLEKLLLENFPGMSVETVDCQTQKERLDELHARCPSRRKATS